MYPELSEAERFPLLSPAGRKWLHTMRQHPRSPAWNWPNGEQLDEAGLDIVRQFSVALQQQPTVGSEASPSWLPAYVDRCLEDVPFYRGRSKPGTPLTSIPSCSRAELAPRIWDFVPDSQSLDELIIFSSSGTTGFPIQTPHHPASAACGIPLIERAISSTGVLFPRGVEQMALTNIAAYRGAYTTAIVIAYLNEAGCIRVNLSPDVWRRPEDCTGYLDEFRAPVMLGDPQAFAALQHVHIRNPPDVMISSIFELSDALAAQLSARYGCPVIDLYALTEAGIVAVKNSHGHAVLPHDIYVEILDEHDERCPPRVTGEVTLTGGRNPFLPLLRYRTGDFAALSWFDSRPTLVGLEGRQPVSFPVHDRIVHSMEITKLLRKYPLAQYQLNQDAEGKFQFRFSGAALESELHEALTDLLGKRTPLVIEQLPSPFAERRKFLVYSSQHPASGSLKG